MSNKTKKGDQKEKINGIPLICPNCRKRVSEVGLWLVFDERVIYSGDIDEKQGVVFGGNNKYNDSRLVAVTCGNCEMEFDLLGVNEDEVCW